MVAGSGWLAQWGRRIAGRGLAGVPLLAVPVASDSTRTSPLNQVVAVGDAPAAPGTIVDGVNDTVNGLLDGPN